VITRVKNFLSSSLITTKNLVTVSHTVCAQEVQKSGDTGAPPLRLGTWPTPRKIIPYPRALPCPIWSF